MFYILLALLSPIALALVTIGGMLWLAGIHDSYEEENQE